MAEFSSCSDIYDEGRHWTWRVSRASLGTTTGLIVLATLAKVPKYGVAFGQTAEIRLDGLVETDCRKNGKWGKTIIGDIIAIRDNFRRLSDHCKLNDADRNALFEELRKWILKDHRATSKGEHLTVK